MRARRKVYLGVVVGVGVVYFCLLLILFLSESGYGDLVPVVSFIASEGVPFFFAWSAEAEELVLFCGLRGGVGGVGGEYSLFSQL